MTFTVTNEPFCVKHGLKQCAECSSQSKNLKKKHGGLRKGAGRPKGRHGEAVTFYCHYENLCIVRALSKHEKLSSRLNELIKKDHKERQG